MNGAENLMLLDGSDVFSPIKIGSLELKNRFVHSATHEAMATSTGEVTDELVNRYAVLAKGEIGLIVPGFLYVDSLGKAAPKQTGIHMDEMIPGLKRIVEAVHAQGGRIAFQLSHAGRQTSRQVIGQTPIAPSRSVRDPINLLRPREMTDEDIHEVVQSFARAARRAAEAGADAIQLHAAHGYLINQFLSPFFNRRSDSWGGTNENRFRFLEAVFSAVRNSVPGGMPILVKLNTDDHTPGKGITPDLAAQYAARLVLLGVEGVEISSGTAFYSLMNVCRGDVPVKELKTCVPFWLRPFASIFLNRWREKYHLTEAYHLAAARLMKPVLGQIPLILVGGMRTLCLMQQILQDGVADLISMSRPFVREPFLVKHMREGKTDRATCISCNRCLGAVLNDRPLRCYQ
jgi:2,4-dienoyl-CoA reductase-like NADH-dependent reductase (Old Yellow Enzyme family)